MPLITEEDLRKYVKQGLTLRQICTLIGAEPKQYVTLHTYAKSKGIKINLDKTRGKARARSVDYRGMIFKSQSELAQHLNVHPTTVSKAILRGGVNLLKGGGQPHNASPVSWDGQDFESQAELARYLGRDPSAVSFSLKKGKLNKLNRKPIFFRSKREPPEPLTEPMLNYMTIDQLLISAEDRLKEADAQLSAMKPKPEHRVAHINSMDRLQSSRQSIAAALRYSKALTK